MSRNSMESDPKAVTLRHDAEARLAKGSAPRSRGVPLGRDALALLFEMAGDPSRSSDALRLLQELQVHQVELDLQREELENSEYDMRLELTRYKAMFEFIPALCLVTTKDGYIIDANPAACTALEICHGELVGRSLQELVKRESHDAWHEMLCRVNAGEQAVIGVLAADTSDRTVSLQFSGSLSAESDVLLFGVPG